ncbi:glycosyl transferase family 41-domain-containing protein [Chiua virens]|nr:glycosyl transferase family 41-domain-containing protein [Chiua virens]
MLRARRRGRHSETSFLLSPKSPKLAFRDVIVAAWATAMTLSFVHASSVPPSTINALAFTGPVNILTRIGDPNFDILEAVHDAGDDLIRLLIDPMTGTLPNVILFPDQIHQLSSFILSSQKGYFPTIQATQLPPNLSEEQYCQESKMALASVLLCLARRFQTSHTTKLFSISDKPFCTVEALALVMHYLAASLCPNASMLNDIGVMLCGLVARLYYEQGLQLDPSHPHLLSNLGSLLKDSGHISRAIAVFNHALTCHPELDIALVNMANTLRDAGQYTEAIPYYQRAISVNPDFADAYCGMCQAMNAICYWNGRSGWTQKAIEFCEKQLLDTHNQTTSLLCAHSLDHWMALIRNAYSGRLPPFEENIWKARLGYFFQDDSARSSWTREEADFLLRLLEWYQTRVQRSLYVEAHGQVYRTGHASMTPIYENMTIPNSGLISTIKGSSYHSSFRSTQNALHTSFTAFTHLGRNLSVHPAPPPPLHGRINVGYVSSDFTDHPLTHLMKSVFGMHDTKRFSIFLYATSPSDKSSYREYYECQSNFHFHDVSSWSVSNIVERIVQDQIHILVNLGGYTKGSRNEVFAARPSPVQISLMGFAGTLGAGWCDYLVCDPIVCPPDLFVQVRAARPTSVRSSGDKSPDIGVPVKEGSDPMSPGDDWIYTECPIYMPHTYFATDHKQSYGAGSKTGTATRWLDELRRRDQLRESIFPDLPKDVIIFANFNQLYKIDPLIFWTWLRILSRVRRSILWLLRFPASGEANLLQTAAAWAGSEVASRIRFTDVAPKETHIARCCVADLMLDTAECSAHTIAADVLWSGTPIIACLWPSHRHKMASRVSASLAYATGLGKQMMVHSREEYEERAVALASACWDANVKRLSMGQEGKAGFEAGSESSELMHLRWGLFLSRETMPLFDTQRWVKNLEKGFVAAWRRWVDGSHFRVGVSPTTSFCRHLDIFLTIMSQAEPPLGAFFVDIVAPARTESTFRCLAELADRAFTLADQQAGLDTSDTPLTLKNRYASILYPVGNTDVEPFPIKAVLHQNVPPMQVQQVVIDFQTKTAECEGQPNLAIEPEQIEYVQEEIKPYLQDVWKRKRARERARQLQENRAWKDFYERLEANGVFSAASSSSSDSEFSSIHRRCPVCDTQTSSCTTCHAIICLNRQCAASQLMPFRSCSHHVSTVACLPCLENVQGVPSLGQCPECHLWFCQFELTWCLGRPKNGFVRPARRSFRQMANTAREHPTKPIGCSSCTAGSYRPHCSNGRCWSRVGGYTSVCASCSPGGGLWCTCEQCWICDDCKATDNCFKACPQCKRVYCVYECEYIQFCAECGRTTLCDDCIEEDWSEIMTEGTVEEGVALEGECQAGHCSGRICGACLEAARCAGCRKTYCSSCVQLQRCEACDGRYCFACYRTRKRQCGGCDIVGAKS